MIKTKYFINWNRNTNTKHLLYIKQRKTKFVTEFHVFKYSIFPPKQIQFLKKTKKP